MVSKNNILKDRISGLSDDLKEEGNGESINQISVDNFLDFMENNSNFHIPTISLTPDNEIYASWNINKLIVKFNANGDWQLFIS